MWREELVAAVQKAFANDPAKGKPNRKEAADLSPAEKVYGLGVLMMRSQS